MKKFGQLFWIAVIILMTLNINSVFAYSDGFTLMMQTLKIPEINTNGLKINEDIYEKYKLLVYGSPVQIKSSKQRFKNTINGNWTLNGGAWNGDGTRGEYWILGEDFSGKSVHNEIFPDDYISGISPEEWNYREIKGAEASWNDISKYTYEIQKEYMLNHKLSRHGIEYNVTPLSIGLNKVRLENCATWKSSGSVYTEKPGNGNIYWVATFSIPPMALNAKINSIIELPKGNEYTISKEEDSIEIPINYGAFVDGLSEYTKIEHISSIESNLKIDGNVVDTVKISEATSTKGNYILTINKNEYPKQKQISIPLICSSLLKTKFEKDPLLYDDEYQTITINIEKEEENKAPILNTEEAPIIYYTKLKRISANSKDNNQTVDLYKVNKTGSTFICAGQVLYIEVKTSPNANSVTYNFRGMKSIVTLDETTKRFEWYEPNERGLKGNYKSLKDLENCYMFPAKLRLKKETEEYKIFSGTYLIPYETTQTLHSWNSLRQISKDAFKIDEKKLFTQRESSYTLLITAKGGREARTKKYDLNVAERWDELYNRNIYEYVSIGK